MMAGGSSEASGLGSVVTSGDRVGSGVTFGLGSGVPSGDCVGTGVTSGLFEDSGALEAVAVCVGSAVS